LLLMADALRDLLLYESWGRSQPMMHAGDLAYHADTILDGKRGTKRASGAGSCFATAAAILSEALDIGKQADSIATETLLSRFETAKRVEQASAAVNVFVPAAAA